MIAFCSAADPRARWLRLVLLAATLSGMLCCIALWLSSREYPLAPMLPRWLILPPEFGPFLLGLVLASLVAAAWYFRPCVLFFLAATLYLFGCDQNREQPWFYIYWVMLLLNLLPEPTALAACRLAFSLVYFWAGVQKLNGTFFAEAPGWFVQPAADFGLPNAVVAVMRDSVFLTPFLEIFIAAGVWLGKTRWFAIVIASILHVGALLFLGPIGHDVNRVTWPWNFAMIALLIVLFVAKEPISPAQAVRELRHSWSGTLVVGLYGFLPVLSFFGLWDAYLSFALYSYNLPNAEIYVSRSFLSRLPPGLESYVYPVKNFNPALQLPYMFEYPIWAQAEIGVPPLPEPRAFLVVFRHIAALGAKEDDCWMLLETRTGRVSLYRAGISHPTVIKQ
ncbi:MAG TPA: hypothetical protein VNV43_13090 [Candidatus Acidoferrales bacterium]|jgi:hypothetical protein|nr:hypothetical protein [Candidatus Acidoferrales bacterium]